MAIPELASADLADGGGCRMMRRYRLRPLLSAFALLTACPVAAQEWDFQLTPYLWGADIDGRAEIGDVGREFGIDFSDLVDLLAGAALVRFEAGTDRHAFMADLVWLDLEPEDEPATIGGVAEANFKSTTLELNYFYKLDALQLDFGVRYWDMDVEIDPALLPAVRRGDDWVDGFIGVRLIGELGRTWNWQARLNVGAGGSDAAFGAEAHFARRLPRGNRFVLGFKALGFDYEDRPGSGLPLAIDTNFLGTTIGYVFD